jgi:hypothetical protein
MSKHVETPTSRLICFGSAKACTNGFDGRDLEDDVSQIKPN